MHDRGLSQQITKVFFEKRKTFAWASWPQGFELSCPLTIFCTCRCLCFFIKSLTFFLKNSSFFISDLTSLPTSSFSVFFFDFSKNLCILAWNFAIMNGSKNHNTDKCQAINCQRTNSECNEHFASLHQKVNKKHLAKKKWIPDNRIWPGKVRLINWSNYYTKCRTVGRFAAHRNLIQI